jgi:hypothetical protein
MYLMITVRFTGDYFSLTTSIGTPVDADWDTAVDTAAELIKGYYGWDVLAVTNDIEVEGHND